MSVWHWVSSRATGHAETSLPNAEHYYANAIILPLYPGLELEHQHEIVEKMTTPIGHQTIF
jgi:dTDP-4-amino-4,6-dideoxygalactose transaminase